MAEVSDLEKLHSENREATYRAIGLFITKFASVEWTLRYYLGLASKIDMHYLAPVITHDFALLCTAVMTVFSEVLKTDEDKKKLKKLISRCRVLNDTRVKVVHGQWFAFHDGGMVAHRSRQTLWTEDTTGMAKLLQHQAEEGRQIFVELEILLGTGVDSALAG
jgi:hypothetical protein